jgi:murein DD-endopeptidase MepM/ murein hydrolase activator NlpD
MTLSNNNIQTSSVTAETLANKATSDDRMGLDLRTMGEGSKEAKIRRVAVQFEEMLISTLLKSAFKEKEPEEKKEEDEESTGLSFGRVNDLRNMFLSQHIADNGGLGYRQVIEEQLKQAYINNDKTVDSQKGGSTAVGASNNVVIRPPAPLLPSSITTHTHSTTSTDTTSNIHSNTTPNSTSTSTSNSNSHIPTIIDNSETQPLEIVQPVDSSISSQFGWRQDPIDGETRFHSGVDFKIPAHTPVRSVMAGEVVFSGWENGYGNLVEIKHPNGMTSRYGHNSKLTVKAGDHVEAGAVIAKSGSTGRSTGPHLHFEIRKENQAINPIAFFQEKNTNVLAKNAEIPNVIL